MAEQTTTTPTPTPAPAPAPTPAPSPAPSPTPAPPPAPPAPGTTVVVQQPQGPAPAQAAGVTQQQVTELFETLLNKRAQGDPIKLAKSLVRQNLQLKDDLVAAQNAATVARAAMPEGHVAVPKADADLLAAYKALGTPDEVRQRAERLATAEASASASARKALVKDVAAFAEWREDVVDRLARTDGVEFLPATEPGRDGAPVPSFRAKGPYGENGAPKEVTLQELISGPWRPFREALLSDLLPGRQGGGGFAPAAQRFEPPPRPRRLPAGPGPARPSDAHTPARHPDDAEAKAAENRSVAYALTGGV
jgi:hypothetical protein